MSNKCLAQTSKHNLSNFNFNKIKLLNDRHFVATPEVIHLRM